MTPRGSDKRLSPTAGSINAVTDLLHTYRYGPARPPQILAVHGLTGHGLRWQTLAAKHLPEFASVAPDLIGHGRSSWAAPWSIDAVASNTHFLNVHRFGPEQPVQILAVHGLTGHGLRWRTLATEHLPGFSILAPDLLGHGRSSWEAPWTVESNVAALLRLRGAATGRPAGR
jgi:alpha-beta hydrolase superfamily lysophospholipase